MTDTPTRPIVRYHGGKWLMAPWIISHFPEHRYYTEAFGGGGSVLLRKPRCYAEVYNDLNGEVVNLFRVARDHGDELRRVVELTPFSRDEFNLSYEPASDMVEQARRTMVRAGMGFGSSGISAANKTGFRGSATRSGTHPAMDWGRCAANLASVVDRLQGVVIENRHAIEVITYHDSPETLHYVDPPYLADTRTWLNGKGAYKHEMSDQDHRELLEVLGTLKGAVVVSGYPSELYDDALRGWVRAEKKASADGRVERTEVLWMRGCRNLQGVLL
jgi:DNA adenine methylase